MPKRKHLQTSKEENTLPAEPSGSLGADDPGELKDFVDNYLTLADKALGFRRRPGPTGQLTISTCLYCQHTLAASNLKLLSFAENLHVCPGKPSHDEADTDGAA